MRRLIWLWTVLALGPPSRAQDIALLSNRDALQLYARAVQLMESTAVAVPELARAGAPVSENARQALAAFEATAGTEHAGLTYTFLTNLRAYLALSDSVPKPYPFPEEARRQFSELRDTLSRIESHFRALLDRKEAQLRSPDRDNLNRYAGANQKLPPSQPDKLRVCFLGDSITDGWRLNEYFTDRDFVNRGISGQITGEMLGRMKADVINLKPAAMHVLAGTNDIARSVPLSTIQNNLTLIADLAEAHKIRLVFASILPVSDYHREKNPQYEHSRRRPPETIRALNAWLEKLCRQRNFIYADYFSQMVDAAGFLRAELADDGLHPNSAGYRIMAPITLEAVNKALSQMAPPAKKRRFPF